MKIFVAFLLFVSLASTLFAESETPAPADLLVVPEVSERPVPQGAPSPQPTPTPENKPMPAENEEPAALLAEEVAPEEIVPPPFPLSRYEDLWKNSPFQLESTAPPVADSAGLAQRYALTGIAEINGEPIAFVMERATQQRMMVRKQADAGGSGLSLVQVDVSQKKYDDSTATLRQGAEVGVVKFDAGPAMSAPATPPPMAQGMRPPQIQPGNPVPSMPQPPQLPGQQGQVAGVPAPQTAPGIVPPVPGPGVPGDGQIQTPGQPQMPPPRVIRRRAIVPAAP